MTCSRVGDASVAQQLLPCVPIPPGFIRPPVDVGEDQVVVAPGRARPKPLGGLGGTVLAQHGDHAGRQRHHARPRPPAPTLRPGPHQTALIALGALRRVPGPARLADVDGRRAAAPVVPLVLGPGTVVVVAGLTVLAAAVTDHDITAGEGV
jgi:hypothetical protein